MPANRFPAFMLYPKDYFSSGSTACFSAEQDGAFLNLLMRSWASDPPCTLPDDDDALAVLSKLGTRWSTSGVAVKAKFVHLPGGLLRNTKLYEIYLNMESEYRRRSKAAKEREKKKKQNPPRGDHAVLTPWSQGGHGVPLPYPYPFPFPEEEKEVREKRAGAELAEERFLEAWALYPRRKGGSSKADSFAAWCARIREGISPDELVAGAKRYAAFVRAERNEDTRYVKQAETFFGPGEHWKREWGGDGRAGANRDGAGDGYERERERAAERRRRFGLDPTPAASQAVPGVRGSARGVPVSVCSAVEAPYAGGSSRES